MLRIDDIHAFGVIGTRDCEKLLNCFVTYDILKQETNLLKGEKYGILSISFFQRGAWDAIRGLRYNSAEAGIGADRH